MPMKTLTRAHLAAIQGGCCSVPAPTGGGVGEPAGTRKETPTPAPPPPPPPGN